MLTYAEVRDWVTTKAGAACDQLSLDLIMQASLRDFWNRLDDLEDGLTQTITVVPGTSSYALTGFDRVDSVRSGNYRVPTYTSRQGRFPTHNGPEDLYNSWRQDGALLVIEPVPTEAATYVVHGVAELDDTLYDLDGLTKVWRYVALPEGIHVAYSEHVLGRAMADTDPARAQLWLSISVTDFNGWRDRKRRGGDDTVVMSRQALRYGYGRRDEFELETLQRWVQP